MRLSEVTALTRVDEDLTMVKLVAQAIDRVIQTALRVIAECIQRLPEVMIEGVATVLGRLCYVTSRDRRAVLLENLVYAFPEKEEHERRLLGQTVCVHLARTLIEFIRIPRYLASGLDDLVRFEGLSHYEAAQTKGKGVLIVTGHLGSYELAVAALGRRISPVSVVTRRRPYGVDRFITLIRQSAGLQTIYARGALRPVLHALKKKESVVFALDRNAAPRKGVFVEFFGKPACTMAGLAVIALRSGAPVIGLSMWREPDGSHVIQVHPEFPLQRRASLQDTIRCATQAYTYFLEEAIRKHPEQWFWPHRRWKTQPPALPRPHQIIANQ
jgi:KDO2-lipid IV(A) lauroyltransferase